MSIETKRLTLDPPSADDDIAMGQMLSNLDTMVFLRYMTKEQVGGWSNADLLARRERHCKAIADKAGSTFYIHDKATKELAGVMGANSINTKDRNATVGIILNKKYWAGGYGTECLYELMRGLFEDLKMHKLTYETTESNFGMRRFLEQTCGIQSQFKRKDEVWCEATNVWITLWGYEIFEQDWPGIKEELQKRLDKIA